MAGIFGPGADLTAQAIQQEQQANAMQWANVPQGRGTVAGMAQAGSMLGSGLAKLGGYEDPRLAKAKLLEEARMEVDSSGADLMSDPKSYYTAAFKALQSRGLTDEAMSVRQLLLEEEAQAALNAKNMRGTTKGYGASGNMLINKDTGEYKVMEGYEGRGSNTDKLITLSPPGSTVKGTGNEKTVKVGSDEFNSLVEEGWIDTSKIPGPDRGQDINVKATFEQQKDRGDIAKEELKSLREKGRNADALRRQTGLLRTQLESTNFDPGILANFRETIASAAQYFGVSDETLSMLRQNPNDANILGSITNNMVGVMANALQSGNSQVSAAELKLFRESAANMSQTAQGMYVLNEIIDRYAAYEQQLRDYATEQYANIPPDGNDANILVNIDRWKRENPFVLDKVTLDRLRRHAQLIEKGKTAKDITTVWSKEPNQNRATKGALYRYKGGLYTYQGDTKINDRVVPDLRPAK